MSDDLPPHDTEFRKRGTVTRRTCDSCFRSKRKCDGKKPCHQCLRNGQLSCDYKRPRRRMVSNGRGTDSEIMATESFNFEMTAAHAKPSISGSRQVPSPAIICDSTNPSNLLEGSNLANGSIRDSEQADAENLDIDRSAPRQFGAFSLPISPSQIDFESFYPESSMMELDWLFGESNGKGITPFNSSGLQWNSSQTSALDYQQPTVNYQATIQANSLGVMEPLRVQKPSPLASQISSTPSWPTDYLSNVDDSDHNRLLASASPQDRAQQYEHEQTLASSAQSTHSCFPQELGRIAINGRIDELPKYLDDDSRRIISVAFWEKWVSKRQVFRKGFNG